MHVMGSVSPASESERFSFQDGAVGFAMPMSPPSPPRSPSRLSDHEGDQIRSPGPPLPPPPPPPPLLPPPPPPPLLPLLPGLVDSAVGLRKKKRVRSFNWKTISEDQVKGRPNLWTQGRVRQQYQIDVQTIEELFGHNDESKITTTRGNPTRGSFREAKEEVSILDSKRAMNIGIFLKQFKRSNQTIADDIRHGNSEQFGAEPLRELLKLLPETEEVKKLTAYRGDISKLPLADSFMYLLIQLPSYSVRIESMLLKEEFPGMYKAMKQDIEILRCATKELMCCEELHAVLHLVLQAGNILNAGGYAGNAAGFKSSSLLSLADTKANRPGMNLLHFVALEAQKKDEKLLEFPLKLSHVQAAARIPLETLDADLQCLTSRTRSVEENVQRDTELLQQLDNFLQHATSSLCWLRGSRQQLEKEGDELIDFFCEDRETFRLDDCFGVFHTFCSKFTNAVKENREREAKEAARRRRMQELEEQKRHSWAGGEQVSGAVGWRCSSESDMSAAVSRPDEAGLLMELLTPKSRPRSPLNNSHGPLGRSPSLRRSRNSPSGSPSIAAECELNALLETVTDRKAAQQRGRAEARTDFPSDSVKFAFGRPGLSPQRVAACMQMEPQTPSSPSPKPTNHATSSYLSCNSTQTGVNTTNPETKIKPTSNSNQHSDDDENSRLRVGFSTEETLTAKMNKYDQVFSELITCSDEKLKRCTAAGNMSVVLEKCTLVPELKVFDEATALTSHNEGHPAGRHRDDTDLDQGAVDPFKVRKETKDSQKSDVQGPETSSSSPQRDEDKGREEKVVVWCVTGVCEVAGNMHNAQTQNEKDPCDNQEGNQQSSSTPANHMPSEPEPANEKPMPISSQPVPVSRCDDPSLPVSSPGWRPAEPAPPDVTTDASEEDKGLANQEVEAQSSTSEKSNEATEPEQSASRHSASSKLSTKNLPTSKPRPAGVKPSSPNNASAAGRSKPVRTLTNSENQGMRRVVPISRTSRGTPSLAKRTENRGSSTVPSSLTASKHNSTILQRGDRPATAPSSRRSSVHKMSDSNNQKLSSTPASAPEKSQNLQRKPSIRKSLMKPKVQAEEKMCRSTLRALAQAGGGGGGNSISAPATPLHKTANPSSSPLPSFARNTASSSFRRSHATLAPPAPSRSSNAGSGSSPKFSPKSVSPVTPPGASPAFTRTGSLRFATSSRSSSGVGNFSSSSSTLRRTQSIRSSHGSPLQNPAAPPKGRQRNNSGSFSDKSTHSRDSGKATRPSWR